MTFNYIKSLMYLLTLTQYDNKLRMLVELILFVSFFEKSIKSRLSPLVTKTFSSMGKELSCVPFITDIRDQYWHSIFSLDALRWNLIRRLTQYI